jgi:hypothetical protein
MHMKKYLLIFLAIGLLPLFSHGTEIRQNTLLGKWTYTVSEAPEGLETGTIVFFVKEGLGMLVGKAYAKNGSEMQLLDVEVENNVVTFGVYVDSDYITVKATIENDTMKGAVQTPDGEQKIEAKKITP